LLAIVSARAQVFMNTRKSWPTPRSQSTYKVVDGGIILQSLLAEIIEIIYEWRWM
jgi:hypothetical protein